MSERGAPAGRQAAGRLAGAGRPDRGQRPDARLRGAPRPAPVRDQHLELQAAQRSLVDARRARGHAGQRDPCGAAAHRQGAADRRLGQRPRAVRRGEVRDAALGPEDRRVQEDPHAVGHVLRGPRLPARRQAADRRRHPPLRGPPGGHRARRGGDDDQERGSRRPAPAPRRRNRAGLTRRSRLPDPERGRGRAGLQAGRRRRHHHGHRQRDRGLGQGGREGQGVGRQAADPVHDLRRPAGAKRRRLRLLDLPDPGEAGVLGRRQVLPLRPGRPSATRRSTTWTSPAGTRPWSGSRTGASSPSRGWTGSGGSSTATTRSTTRRPGSGPPIRSCGAPSRPTPRCS